MFSYRYESATDDTAIPDGVKKALGWIAATIAVGFMWTLPFLLMVLGLA